jgi:hypothetical protein
MGKPEKWLPGGMRERKPPELEIRQLWATRHRDGKAGEMAAGKSKARTRFDGREFAALPV